MCLHRLTLLDALSASSTYYQYACGASALPSRYPSKANGIKYEVVRASHLEFLRSCINRYGMRKKEKTENTYYDRETN